MPLAADGQTPRASGPYTRRMERPLRIALVSPHAFPPGDDVGHAVAAEAEALARRGHAVTILAPGKGRPAADAGRRRIEALEAGDADAIAAAPGGAPLVVATSRALRTSAKGTGRRLGGPIEGASGLEIALGMGGFDVARRSRPARRHNRARDRERTS